jgi:hypothetical protein
MLKHYKNLTGKQIDVTLFGVGRVVVPADAGCVPIKKNVADVINKMAFPNVILEEVEVTYTAVENPVVKEDENGMPFKEEYVPAVASEQTPDAVNVEAVEELDELEEIADLEDGLEGEVNPVDAYTKAELIAMCEERGISVSARDTKADLYGKLF